MNYTLDLDDGFSPYKHLFAEQLKFSSFVFSGGEVSIKLEPSRNIGRSDKVFVTNRLRNSDGVMLTIMAIDALKRLGFSERSISLYIPYIPYARQDRVCNSGEAFSLKVFADMLNALGVHVTMLDAHSDVAPALLDDCANISNFFIVDHAIRMCGEHVAIVSPDSGANKKINKLVEQLSLESVPFQVVKCDKVRDLATGKLNGFQVFADDLNGTPCMIVDDICDGGRTFIGIAEGLKKKNAGNLYLCITHGIFSAGFDELAKHFKKVYCSNSFSDISNPLVSQIDIINYTVEA